MTKAKAIQLLLMTLPFSCQTSDGFSYAITFDCTSQYCPRFQKPVKELDTLDVGKCLCYTSSYGKP